jgi:hypothetical protein
MSSSGNSYRNDEGQYNPYAGGTVGVTSPMGDPNFAINSQRPFPTAVTVIGILFLVFGILGLFTGAAGILQGIFFQFIPTNSLDPNSARTMNAMAQAAPINMVTGTLNLGLSTCLIITATGLLKKRLWGAKFGATTAILAILYKLFESAGGCYAQWMMMDQMQNSMYRNSPNVDPSTMRWMMIIGMVIGLVIFATPLMIFYGWVAYYLKRDATRSHFSPSSTNAGSVNHA